MICPKAAYFLHFPCRSICLRQVLLPRAEDAEMRKAWSQNMPTLGRLVLQVRAWDCRVYFALQLSCRLNQVYIFQQHLCQGTQHIFNACVCAHTNTHTCAHVHKHTHTNTHARTHAQACKNTHTHTHAHAHAHTHTNTHKNVFLL